MTVGIDLIHFATADFYLGLDTFAQEKGTALEKYTQGIGQEKMSIAPPDEDIVTLAAKASAPILAHIDKQAITAVLFATESGIDQSKSAGAFLHGLLGLSHRCRTIELKHACYGGTAALQMASALVHANPAEQILVIASDIAKYEVDSSGEATQGCGAVAMLVKANPRILAIEPGSGYYTEDVMDFWRPNHRTTALVDGKYSTKVYLNSLKQAWWHFVEQTGRTFEQIDAFCYHIPFSRMTEKAHKTLTKTVGVRLSPAAFEQQVQPGQQYNRVVGNSYSASLFIGFCSFLDHAPHDLTHHRFGLFSYGSGCVAEFFTGVVQPGYQSVLFRQQHQEALAQRQSLSYQDYLHFYYPQIEDPDHTVFAQHNPGPYRLSAIKQSMRQYQSHTETPA